MSRVGDMSSALSEQSWVRKGAGYDEVNLSGQDDPGTSSNERSLSTSSPSSRNEDLDMDGLESDSNNNFVNAEPPPQSIIGPDGLREFILLPLWMVNEFKFTIKQKHFDTLKDKYQIPHNIPIYLLYKSEKCYYQGVNYVGVYEQMLKVGLRFPLSALHCRLLQVSTKCPSLSPPAISWVGRHPSLSKLLEGFSWRRSSV